MCSPYLSVIIPFYNIKQHIENGVQNLISQTYENFEAILVDDGSTDGSGDMLDEWAKKDKRIVVVHQQNTGAGGARNHGIDIATGKYIWFYDADDKIESDTLETIVSQLANYGYPEMLVFGYDETDCRLRMTNVFKFAFKECRTNTEVAKIYPAYLSGMTFNNGFVWNKVYKREFLVGNSIRFGNLRIQQDEVFNMMAYRKLQSVVIIPHVLYHYFVYNSGNTRSGYIPERFEIYKSVRDAYLDLINYWELTDDQLLRYVYNRFFNSIIETIRLNCYHPQSFLRRKERLQKIREIAFSEEAKNCIDHLESLQAIPKHGFLKRYFLAVRKQNLFMLLVVRKNENVMCRIKTCVRNLLCR